MKAEQITITALVLDAHENSRAKGWWDGVVDPAATIPEKLALIHSEVSEALEDYRAGKMDARYVVRCGQCVEILNEPVDAHDKPIGFPTELADIVIRVADLAGALGIDLEAAVREKIAYNATRPHRHGGKRC